MNVNLNLSNKRQQPTFLTKPQLRLAEKLLRR